jgi:hypothetical protein
MSTPPPKRVNGWRLKKTFEEKWVHNFLHLTHCITMSVQIIIRKKFDHFSSSDHLTNIPGGVLSFFEYDALPHTSICSNSYFNPPASSPCPCCDPSNTHGYVCPKPIIVPEDPAEHQSLEGHASCNECKRLFPSREDVNHRCSSSLLFLMNPEPGLTDLDRSNVFYHHLFPISLHLGSLTKTI